MPTSLSTPSISRLRFGGPGIKKKACIARICRNAAALRSGDADDDAQGDGEEAEEEQEEQQQHQDVTALHIDVEVAQAASEESSLQSAITTIVDACKRQPLTPIRHSTSSSNLQGFDMLARTALQTIPC